MLGLSFLSEVLRSSRRSLSYIKSQGRRSHHGSVVTNPTGIQEDTGSIPGLGSGMDMSCNVGHRHGLNPTVAVVQAGGCSPNLTHSLGTYLCRGRGPKKTKKKERKNKAGKGKLSNIVLSSPATSSPPTPGLAGDSSGLKGSSVFFLKLLKRNWLGDWRCATYR